MPPARYKHGGVLTTKVISDISRGKLPKTPFVLRVLGSELGTTAAPGGTMFGALSQESAHRFKMDVADGDMLATKAELTAESCELFPILCAGTDIVVHSCVVSKIRVGGVSKKVAGSHESWVFCISIRKLTISNIPPDTYDPFQSSVKPKWMQRRIRIKETKLRNAALLRRAKATTGGATTASPTTAPHGGDDDEEEEDNDGGDDDDDDDGEDDDDDDDADEPFEVVKQDVAPQFESLGLPKYPYYCDHGEVCSEFVDCVVYGPIAFDHCIVRMCHPSTVNIAHLQHQYQFANLPPPQ
jgi:hypothetical protein